MTPCWASFGGRCYLRTIFWDDETAQLGMIDQRNIPEQLNILYYKTYQSVAEAIQLMVVRGAPAIGAAAAYGMALAGLASKAVDANGFKQEMQQAALVLNAARPTAINLAWAINRMIQGLVAAQGSVDALKQQLLASAHAIADEDVAMNKKIAEHGAALIEDGDHIVHHCNTGALATVDWGTALGAIRTAHEQGKHIHVFVDETRPRLQGARLTAWELSQYGIPYDIISDNASGWLMRTGQVNKVFFGADRVTANGDVANKIGSYMLALAAYDNGIPVYSVFPTSTVDMTLACGDMIPIEERDATEVLEIQFQGQRVTPLGASARNPAFDVTPNRLISGLVTEKGVIRPPFITTLKKIMDVK